jgi:tetratricopeptide (TPR) repeat protein
MPKLRGRTKWGILAALTAAVADAAVDFFDAISDLPVVQLSLWSVPVLILVGVVAAELHYRAQMFEGRHEIALADRHARRQETLVAMAQRAPGTLQYIQTLHADGDLGLSLILARGNAYEFRQLYDWDPGYRRLLASSLFALGDIHSDRLEPDAAIAALTEAVDLLHTEPGRSTKEDVLLASIAHNLAIEYGRAERPAEGVVAAQEAVTLWSRLSASDPDSAPRHAVQALTLLGSLYTDVGPPDRAVETLRDAVHRYRQLGDEPLGHAHALYDLAFALASAGRVNEAATALEESLQTYRRTPPREEPDRVTFARVLLLLGSYLLDRDDPAACLPLADEAVRASRALNAAAPDPDPTGILRGTAIRHCRRLAQALEMRAKALSGIGRTTEGAAASAEAAELRRSMSRDEG